MKFLCITLIVLFVAFEALQSQAQHETAVHQEAEAASRGYNSCTQQLDELPQPQDEQEAQYRREARANCRQANF